jgi:hypothetical protein
MSKPVSDSMQQMVAAPLNVAMALAGAVVNRTTDGCEIPPPCWEPRHAGTCAFVLSPGAMATVRLHVTNCGWNRQVVAVTALGKLAGWMSFAPTALLLDPQERATIVAKVTVPDKVPIGQRFSAPIIVRGCRDHYVRLEVTVAECAEGNCCDVSISDCADHVHHWYDHFYCRRPCRNVRVPGSTGVAASGATVEVTRG